jgi:pimeloyl-ACP methyl ester carboxylesterase
MSAPAVQWFDAAAKDAPTALLLHGLENTWASWRPLAAHLSQRWRVGAAELPWSAGNDYRWRREAPPAAWVADTLASCDEPPGLVVAHSFGAAALLEVLSTQPSTAVGSAVLIAPFYLHPKVTPSWRLFDVSRQQFHDQIRDGLRVNLGRRAAVIDPAIFERIAAKVMDRIGPAGFVAVFDQYLATASFPLAAVRVPGLVITGEDDVTLLERDAAALAEAPALTVVRKRPYGHFCHIRQPDQVARDITEFVDHCQRPAATDPTPTRELVR